jgi:hypothetical protein
MADTPMRTALGVFCFVGHRAASVVQALAIHSVFIFINEVTHKPVAQIVYAGGHGKTGR